MRMLRRDFHTLIKGVSFSSWDLTIPINYALAAGQWFIHEALVLASLELKGHSCTTYRTDLIQVRIQLFPRHSFLLPIVLSLFFFLYKYGARVSRTPIIVGEAK